MPKSSNEQVRRETELIRSLFYEKGLTEHQILEQLGIDRVTLYRYFKRIHAEDAKIWKQSFLDPNLVRARDIQLQRILEEGLAFNIKLMNNERAEPRDRIEASKIAAVFAAHLSKLAREGPTLLMLPEIKAHVVEVKPLESKV